MPNSDYNRIAMECNRKVHAGTNAATYGSVEELAGELGLSRQSVYGALRNGSIPSIRVGKRFILPRVAIAEWLRSAGANPRPTA